MLTILEDTLTKFGYKGKEVKFVVTDVVDPNGNTFTSTKEHITVLDREFLANATKEDLIKRVAHEFGHYSKADDETKSQKVAKYFSEIVMDKVKGVESKEATVETYSRIRNNKNLIIGKEGREVAESIPQEDREYFSKLITFITNSEVAGSPAIVDKEDKNIVKIGNKFYYGDYEIVGMQEWSYGKDKYMLTLDYNSKAPSIGKMSTLMSVAKLVSTITDPTTTILNSKELKK